MKKTKVICTLGPSSSDHAVLEKMINAGMNIARLNFSHGTYEEHGARIKLVRDVASSLGKPVGILADIRGAKIRTGILSEEPLILSDGSRILLSIDQGKEQTPGYIYVHYPSLLQDLHPGSKIFLADGMIELQAVQIGSNDVECEVTSGGELTSREALPKDGPSS